MTPRRATVLHFLLICATSYERMFFNVRKSAAATLLDGFQSCEGFEVCESSNMDPIQNFRLSEDAQKPSRHENSKELPQVLHAGHAQNMHPSFVQFCHRASPYVHSAYRKVLLAREKANFLVHKTSPPPGNFKG
jgi:hypothetical protein